MLQRRLVYLGPEPAASGERSPEPLRYEGRPLEPDATIDLVRRRSPWNPAKRIERIVMGSNPTRADVLLEGEGLAAEHARLYLSTDDPDVNDLRAMQGVRLLVNGREVDVHEWCALKPGDEVQMGCWRFRFSVGDAAR